MRPYGTGNLLRRENFVEVFYIDMAYWRSSTQRKLSEGPLRREDLLKSSTLSVGPLRWEDLLPKRLYGESFTPITPAVGLLQREDLLDVFYAEKTFRRSSILRRPFVGLLNSEDLQMVFYTQQIF